MDEKRAAIPAEDWSEKGKSSDLFTKITTWVFLLLHYVGIPMGLFVFCKFVLGLVLPWWMILLSPVWCFLAGFIHGGYVITVLILWLCRAMATPWWVWAAAIIYTAVRLIRFVLALIREGN